MSNAPRFLASRTLTSRAGVVLAVEMLVRIGDLEARGLAKPGEAPSLWNVRRAGRWTRPELDLNHIRRTVPGGGRALAKACARLARAA